MKIGFKKGFTLIELLIVIAIIGILAVALLPTILSAPAKGRDAARKAHLNALVTAIEAYNLEKSGYPPAGTGGVAVCITDATFSTVKPFLQGGAVPVDPLGIDNGPMFKTGCRGNYLYGWTNKVNDPYTNYWLAAYMEIKEDANTVSDNDGVPLTGNTATTPKLKAPTAACTPFTPSSGAINPTSGCAYVVIK